MNAPPGSEWTPCNPAPLGLQRLWYTLSRVRWTSPYFAWRPHPPDCRACGCTGGRPGRGNRWCRWATRCSARGPVQRGAMPSPAAGHLPSHGGTYHRSSGSGLGSPQCCAARRQSMQGPAGALSSTCPLAAVGSRHSWASSPATQPPTAAPSCLTSTTPSQQPCSRRSGKWQRVAACRASPLPRWLPAGRRKLCSASGSCRAKFCESYLRVSYATLPTWRQHLQYMQYVSILLYS
mmetsp:Transcript_5244/g.14648  ORF Transcript_5244/g.14648 Transcript_5244/m.14648 type:complete len:235 (+) Transcript_5244:1042-1746(+)